MLNVLRWISLATTTRPSMGATGIVSYLHYVTLVYISIKRRVDVPCKSSRLFSSMVDPTTVGRGSQPRIRLGTGPRDCQDGLPIKPDPSGTTPGRFSAWQSHGVSAGEKYTTLPVPIRDTSGQRRPAQTFDAQTRSRLACPNSLDRPQEMAVPVGRVSCMGDCYSEGLGKPTGNNVP